MKTRKRIQSALLFLVCGWILFVGLPSFRSVRGLLIRPLYVHDPEAKADSAYIMGGSDAIFERVRAASDLYHMHRVQSIYYYDDHQTVGHNFVKGVHERAGERTRDYLRWLGVPDEALHAVPGASKDSWLSSRDEAVRLAEALPKDTSSVVVVTSAPHTRRSLLCFQRKLPATVRSTAYAASVPSDGAELYLPIWLEYLKLAAYSIFA